MLFPSSSFPTNRTKKSSGFFLALWNPYIYIDTYKWNIKKSKLSLSCSQHAFVPPAACCTLGLGTESVASSGRVLMLISPCRDAVNLLQLPIWTHCCPTVASWVRKEYNAKNPISKYVQPQPVYNTDRFITLHFIFS